ncbi:MAG TPA: sodium-translocating pyrophosphatase [bacterium]|nr:sodium-translocating pyrophosphatase [bacterium]
MGNIGIILAISASVVAIIYSMILVKTIKDRPKGSKKMADIARAIKTGASTYLSRQYSKIALTVIVIFTALLYLLGWKTALGFLIGASLSALAGYVGMSIAVRANVRTAEAAKSNLHKALNIAFDSGMVMSLMVVGLGLLASALFWVITKDTGALIALGFGGSLVALFARVGGGIFTKAADVGADLCGKVEAGIPEDDPRNPAVIADNVGDNVGDVAGMGADLYESYVDSIVVAMAIGVGLFSDDKGIYLPLVLASAGIAASILGSFLIRILKKTKPQMTLNIGIYASALLMAGFSYLISKYYVADIKVFFLTLIGLVAGVAIGMITEYYTSDHNLPTRKLAASSEGGAGPNIISGLALGMVSTAYPVVIIAVAILVAYKLSDLYGIAIAAVGMLSTLGITLATDTYGPVADNAAGISEMAGLDPEARKNSEELDAVGNTTAAVGKGFAIGSAALTALALFAGYTQAVGLGSINLLEPRVIAGMLIGAMLPFIFSSLTIHAVGEAAKSIVDEVRRQFRTIPGIMTGKSSPDYKNCIKISTDSALRKMITPAIMAVSVPIAVGFTLGPEALGGLLGGGVATGFVLALFMANAGGAWDNAKKYIESGHLGGKGSDAHKAAVIGDTVGDPLKDTSGPSLNILIKLMSIVAFLIAPLVVVQYSFKIRAIVAGSIFVIVVLYYLFIWLQPKFAKKRA